MRHATNATRLETGGAVEQTGFKINANGKAFRILIDGLYSNKKESIVRELSSNAWDSHKKLGTTKPFFVHCPTPFRPEFFVRDYGVGMTHATVMDLYSTLFASDKDETDDLVGMFGLGSKSPFAYTDQFCVSCYDGVNVRHYGAGIGEGGVPQIILMSTEPCNEPLGVRVSFAVESKDFDDFEKAINRVSLAFDPLFETNKKLTSELGFAEISGDGWQAYRGGNLPSEFNVRQGCVIYPLEGVGGIKLPSTYSYGDKAGRKYLFECPIGTVEVTSSREKIAYSTKVVDYLKGRLAKFLKEYPTLIAEKAKHIENVHDYFKMIEGLKPSFVKDGYAHPETGLTSETIKIESPACIMNVGYSSSGNRWEYSTEKQVEARPADAAKDFVIEIKDITLLLDVARDPKSALNEREHRRVSRLLRAYVEAHMPTAMVTFWLGLKWTDRFIEICLPNIERKTLTVKDLFNIVPGRRGERPAEQIRGVAMIKGDSNEQRPVTSLEGTPKECAWVMADHFRAHQRGLRALATYFGVTEFYVASSNAVKQLKESHIPSLQEHIDAYLRENYKIGWSDWVALHNACNRLTYNSRNIFNFVKVLEENSPDQFKRLTASKTFIAVLVKALAPFVRNGLVPFNRLSNLESVIELLNKRAVKQPLEPHTQNLVKCTEVYAAHDGSPQFCFLHALTDRTEYSVKQMKLAVTALIAAFTTIPVTEKSKKWKDL